MDRSTLALSELRTGFSLRESKRKIDAFEKDCSGEVLTQLYRNKEYNNRFDVQYYCSRKYQTEIYVTTK